MISNIILRVKRGYNGKRRKVIEFKNCVNLWSIESGEGIYSADIPFSILNKIDVNPHIDFEGIK